MPADVTTTSDWITAGAAVVAAVGTVAAAIAAAVSARASAGASQQAAKTLVMQTEREAALAVDDTLRALEVEAAGDGWKALGALHNRWQDGAGVPAQRLRDAETQRRVGVVGHVLNMAIYAATNEHTSYAFLVAVEDARVALNALLHHETPPPSNFPDRNALTELCPITANGRSFEPLNEWLSVHFPGFRQLG